MQLIEHSDSPRYVRLHDDDNVVVVVNDGGLGEGARCMTHDLWASLNTRMVEFLDSVTLQKLVDDQLAKGLQIEDKPSIKRAISAMPVVKPIRVNAPNSVFALGNAFSKS